MTTSLRVRWRSRLAPGTAAVATAPLGSRWRWASRFWSCRRSRTGARSALVFLQVVHLDMNVAAVALRKKRFFTYDYQFLKVICADDKL